ncbi:hypothetical protein BC829DRAFT_385193 [Chytridium lagenaria]|nr:hypothetical protein BC829DRAFT_385193 [Chytridium lagenaria]
MSSSINLTNTILALASVAAGSIFGLTLLSLCAARMTYPSAALWFDLAIAVKCFGVSVSYLVIIRTWWMPKVILALFPSLPLTSLILSPTFWVTTAIFLVSPLAYARRLDSLKHTSALALMRSSTLFLWSWDTFLAGRGITWDAEMGGDFFQRGLPIFVFAFTCHQNVEFAVHNELVDNTINRVTSVVHYSIGTSTIVYQLVGPVITLGQCALALLFLLSYPSNSRHVAITTMLLIGSFIIAVSVENLDTVLSLVGATGSTTICYILPGILYYKMRDDLDRYGLGIRPTTEEDEEDLQASFTGGSSGGPLRRRSVSVLKYAAAGLAVFGVVVMVVSVSSQIAALASGGNAGGGHLKRREWSSVLA